MIRIPQLSETLAFRTSVIFSALAMITAWFSSCSPVRDEHGRDIAELQAIIEFMASDSLEGRGTGTEGEAKAAAYVASRFEELGLKPFGDSSSFFQAFSFRPHPPIQRHGSGDSTSIGMALVQNLTGKNVIGMLDNGASETIIIGAHHDHLGMGDENSLFIGDSEIHNGADDNASGISALILLAERLSAQPLNYNVLFMSFSGEEKGLYGSNHFVDNPTIDLNTVNYMINMDMVGRMKEDSSLAVYGTGTSPVWNDLVNQVNIDSLALVFHESGVGPSDHTSFYLADMPVLHFFTGQHEDYHKPTDDPEKINYEGILMVADFVERIVLELDDEAKLEFTKTKDQSKDDSPRFNVTLGVVPDYMFDGEGMRIDGVSEDRPAFNAGIIKGDVVTQMGDHAVTDMNTYMEGLGIFEEGDTTVVKVMREGTEKSFDVIWD
ncbi:M28 family peptidase [Sanyastnella coralliicola]|uniref:M28 family peptidase n=1 Tax=Sanyastnella coralliicola TaxID=3069118 RepID=UPI0027BAC24B|nr:M28 family peptidase [Longitalea sp. SCSIO 12813]